MIEGCTRRWNGPCAKPQSVPAITFSRPDDLRQPHDALGDQLGMFDDVSGVADDTGDQHLSVPAYRMSLGPKGPRAVKFDLARWRHELT
jgi:hypothetical protein